MEEFNIDAFLEGLENDKPANNGSSDRITKLLMNTRDNQGSVTIIPFMAKTSKNFYTKIQGVKEWRGNTTQIDTEDRVWHKILPIEAYGELSDENMRLYTEVLGLYETVAEKDVFDWNDMRQRNYTFMYGAFSSHINTKGDVINTNLDDNPVLLIYPSLSPIDALSTAIATKVQALRGKKEWITSVLSPHTKGRKGVVGISFKKSAGAGYDCSVSFELNSEFDTVVDPERDFTEMAELFNDPIRDWLGWQGKGDEYFNPEVFKELRQDLKLTLKDIELNSQVDNSDPMESSDSEKKERKAPF